MSDLTVLVPEFVVTKSLPENSLIIGSKIESNRKRKAGENNRGGEIFGGGKYTVRFGNQDPITGTLPVRMARARK